MFGMLKNLTKATLNIAVVPVSIVTDIVKLPVTAVDHRRDPFENTAKRLSDAGKCLDKALDPKRD